MESKLKKAYKILEVSHSATADDIHKAFRNKVKAVHPDFCKEPGAKQRYEELSEAYDVLNDLKIFKSDDQAQFPDAQKLDADSPGFSDDWFESRLSSGKGEPSKGGKCKDLQITLEITAEEAKMGCYRSLRVRLSNGETKPIKINLPAGLADGARMCLPDEGDCGGDLFLNIVVKSTS